MKDRPQALFLDRDGTLIEFVDYLCDPAQVVLMEGVADALRAIKGWGCKLFLHTNQSGVGRGFFTLDDVNAVNQEMVRLIGLGSGVFDGICIATDHSEEVGNPTYRKPSPKFENEMVELYSLEREYCYVVGDSVSDAETGRMAGMQMVGVRNSKREPVAFASDVSVFSSFSEFFHALLLVR
ncbi:HAD-IIIA family hydrolase [Pelagicoccus enzymogenes]|uniref:HAD-IIIA family hydrolase n=1 Tax=Pelagicoccus enzymogenes TaxID=2773457 RepID=UPI00280C5690|nr:HAD-IIIA family hydrolase [Pelagicoccus enzymogenes]MDQ8199770.1 HAD-IIIA family hydrolase [Pelagicoccus enzymogenes]